MAASRSRPYPQFAPPHPLPGRTYLDALDRRIGSSGDRKGEIRKLKLLRAAAQILGDRGYHDLLIAEVVEYAKAARGTFYIYYDNKFDIAHAVFTDFRKAMFDAPLNLERTLSWEEKIYRTNLFLSRTYQLNNGLMRAFLQFSDLSEDFQQMRATKEDRWAHVVLRTFCRESGVSGDHAGKMDLLRRIHSLQAMTIRMAHILYVERRPDLEELFPAAHDLAVTVSEIWIETLRNITR